MNQAWQINKSAITFKQLRVFEAVARTGSVTEAAEQLFQTKSAVSMALKELEQHLSQSLFQRSGNRLLLNRQGEQLRPLVDEMLQRLDDLAPVLSGDQVGGSLAIGASKTIGNHLLAPLLADFNSQHPCDFSSLVVQNTAQLEQRLLDFELDVLLLEGRIDHPKLHFQRWQTDQMLVIAPVDHPLLDGQRKSPAKLNHQRWVLRELASGTRQQFEVSLAAHLKNWQLAFEINTNEAVISAVSAGFGLGFVSELAAADAIAANRVKVVELGKPCYRQFYLVTHKDRYQSGLVERFIQFCLTEK